jgi:hypothetical protein
MNKKKNCPKRYIPRNAIFTGMPINKITHGDLILRSKNRKSLIKPPFSAD